LLDVEQTLFQFEMSEYRLLGLRWFILILFSSIFAVSFYVGVLPLINFFLYGIKDSSEMEQYLMNDDMIPLSTSIQDAITDEVMITAWDYNNRSPRFFTKANAKLYTQWTTEHYNHDMTLGQMALASASTPYYLRPAEIKGETYVSGDYLAQSPAMFAYLYANQRLGKDLSKMRVLRIGATNELPEKLDSTASLLDWGLRLATLTTPAKKATHDYTIQQMLGKFGKRFYKLETDVSRTFELLLYNSFDRIDTIKELFETLVYEDREELDLFLKEIVTERFKTKTNAE